LYWSVNTGFGMTSIQKIPLFNPLHDVLGNMLIISWRFKLKVPASGHNDTLAWSRAATICNLLFKLRHRSELILIPHDEESRF